MATSTKILLTTDEKPAFFVAPLRADSAARVSELLQENHEKHHAYFNNDGFHNHITHHLLTLYALGAPPSALTTAYTSNATYQRPLPHTPTPLPTPAAFAAHLGDQAFYPDYLAFFASEIAAHGVPATLATHLFARTPAADDLLVRTYAGFLHPLIHLGFGIEFGQPAIVAEGLAQAATHDAWIGEYLQGAEEAAVPVGEGRPMRELLDEVRREATVAGAARWGDANKIRDGVIARAGREMSGIAGKWRVREEDLERRTAEMVDAAVFFTTTAQRPPHVHKCDFFYMHALNSSIFYSAFLHRPDVIPRDALCRLLEWKGRMDLALYASRGAPPLLERELAEYVPKRGEEGGWEGLIARVNAMGEDDGHASKYVRAVANGAKVCAGQEGLAVGDERRWWLAAAMGVDGVEAGGPKWVRSCGFEEAWKDVPLREEGRRAQL